MPVEVRLDTVHRLVKVVAEGVVTIDELRSARERAIEIAPDGVDAARMVDLSGVTTFDLRSEDIGALALAETPPGAVTPGSRLAIVAPSNEAFGLARMYQELHDDGPEVVQVFRSHRDAERWLGVDPSLAFADASRPRSDAEPSPATSPSPEAGSGAPVRYRVIRSWTSSYDQELVLADGVTVSVQPRDSEWPGWLWCVAGDGTGGWVPQTRLEVDGDVARATRDYTSRELSVAVGDHLVGREEELGWVWCVDDAGNEGWVPVDRLVRM